MTVDPKDGRIFRNPDEMFSIHRLTGFGLDAIIGKNLRTKILKLMLSPQELKRLNEEYPIKRLIEHET